MKKLIDETEIAELERVIKIAVWFVSTVKDNDMVKLTQVNLESDKLHNNLIAQLGMLNTLPLNNPQYTQISPMLERELITRGKLWRGIELSTKEYFNRDIVITNQSEYEGALLDVHKFLNEE